MKDRYESPEEEIRRLRPESFAAGSRTSRPHDPTGWWPKRTSAPFDPDLARRRAEAAENRRKDG